MPSRSIAASAVGTVVLFAALTVAVTAAGSTPPRREPNGGSGAPSISANGARVAFSSDAANLVVHDSNAELTDPFVRDLARDRTIVADRTRQRRHALGGGRLRRSPGSAISANGRYVVFSSSSADLGSTGGKSQVWRRDLGSGQLLPVSAASGAADGDSENPAISADGNVVVFESRATNLAGDDNNTYTDIYWRDVRKGVTRRVSVPLEGTDTAGDAGSSLNPTVSADGRFVAFTNAGGNLVTGAGSSATVFRRDMATAVIDAVDVPPGFATSAGFAAGGGAHPSISADGRFVLFDSSAIDLPGGSENGPLADVFIRDMATEEVSLVSRGRDGATASADATAGTMTPDARFVAFTSAAANLAPGDANGAADVFVRDRVTGVLGLASTAAGGAPGNAPSVAPALSADGRFVAFLTLASNLTRQPGGPARVLRKDLTTGALAPVAQGFDLKPRTVVRVPAGRMLIRSRLHAFEGTAQDDFAIARVEIAASQRSGGRCLWLSSRRGRAGRAQLVPRACDRPLFLKTRVRRNLGFTYEFRGRLPRGSYTLRSRATDDRHQVEDVVSRGRNSVRFRLR